MMDLFQDLVAEHKALIWIDDLMAYASTFTEYLDIVKRILSKCDEVKLRLHMIRSN